MLTVFSYFLKKAKAGNSSIYHNYSLHESGKPRWSRCTRFRFVRPNTFNRRSLWLRSETAKKGTKRRKEKKEEEEKRKEARTKGRTGVARWKRKKRIRNEGRGDDETGDILTSLTREYLSDSILVERAWSDRRMVSRGWWWGSLVIRGRLPFSLVSKNFNNHFYFYYLLPRWKFLLAARNDHREGNSHKLEKKTLHLYIRFVLQRCTVVNILLAFPL